MIFQSKAVEYVFFILQLPIALTNKPTPAQSTDLAILYLEKAIKLNKAIQNSLTKLLICSV